MTSMAQKHAIPVHLLQRVLSSPSLASHGENALP